MKNQSNPTSINNYSITDIEFIIVYPAPHSITSKLIKCTSNSLYALSVYIYLYNHKIFLDLLVKILSKKRNNIKSIKEMLPLKSHLTLWKFKSFYRIAYLRPLPSCRLFLYLKYSGKKNMKITHHKIFISHCHIHKFPFFLLLFFFSFSTSYSSFIYPTFCILYIFFFGNHKKDLRVLNVSRFCYATHARRHPTPRLAPLIMKTFFCFCRFPLCIISVSWNSPVLIRNIKTK